MHKNYPYNLGEITTVKKYGNTFKLVTIKFNIKGSKNPYVLDLHKKNKGINKEKLKNNISRAKSKVLEYGLCNDFDYFVTLTLNKEKYDRYNLEIFIKDLGIFLNNYKNKISYVLIPEMHKDGAWHLHGLISGIDKKDLINFDDIPNRIFPSKLLKHNFFNFYKYEKKFGFCSFGKIRTLEFTCKYILKYINKNQDNTIQELNKHSFYSSNDLKVAEKIKEGVLMCNDDLVYDFENDWVLIKSFKNYSPIFDYIMTSFKV